MTDAERKRKIDEYAKKSPEELLKIVEKNGWELEFIENQTPEICLEAVKQNGFILEYVKEQTPEICSAAIENCEYARQYVKEDIILVEKEQVLEKPPLTEGKDYPKEISLGGDRKLINKCKKNKLYTFNPQGEWNGYGYERLPMAVVINSIEQEKLFNIIIEEVAKERENEKPTLTEEEKMEKWANRLAKLTGIDKEDALEIAKEKIEYKEEKIQEMEERQYDRYSKKRQTLINKMSRENPLRYIKDEDHADNILIASKRHTASNYEAELEEGKQLAAFAIIDKGEVKERARQNFKYNDRDNER